MKCEYEGKWMTNKNMINLFWNKSGEPVNHYGEIVKFKIFQNLLNIWGNPGNWKLFIAFELLMTSTWFKSTYLLIWISTKVDFVMDNMNYFCVKGHK